MLRPVDIAVLLRLSLPGSAALSFQQLASTLHLSSSEVHASFKRSRLSGLLAPDASKSVNRSALLDFLENGIRYAFPVEHGEITRGLPTSYATEPLKGLLQANGEPPPVWPHLEGKVRGYSFAPLYKHAAAAALEDSKLYELLSLADALRDGRARERNLALIELRKRIAHHA